MESLSVLALLMTLVYAIIVVYMRRGWTSIPFFSLDKDDISSTKVSVLIAARNEEENIGRTLDALVAQTYPKELFEVIVVDDHSDDSTADIVRRYADRGVRLLQLDEGDKLNSYKKLAIDKAIGLSTGDIIMTTDADCRMGKDWIKTIVQLFDKEDLVMISSPVAYHEEKSFFERLQTLEFMYLIGLGAAGIGNRHPTTCNGANFAYRKPVFYEVGGFKGIDDVASGDDELLLHKVARRYPHKIGFCKSYDAVVLTDAKPDLASFISQRKRWASKSTKYKDLSLVALGVVVWLFNLLMVMGTIQFFFLLPDYNAFFLMSLAVKCLAEWILLRPIVQFFRRPGLIYLLFPLTVVHCFYFAFIGVAGNIGTYQWKGRNVK